MLVTAFLESEFQWQTSSTARTHNLSLHTKGNFLIFIANSGNRSSVWEGSSANRRLPVWLWEPVRRQILRRTQSTSHHACNGSWRILSRMHWMFHVLLVGGRAYRVLTISPVNPTLTFARSFLARYVIDLTRQGNFTYMCWKRIANISWIDCSNFFHTIAMLQWLNWQ